MIADLPAMTSDQLFALPPRSTLVLTVNNRLARRIGMEFASHLRSNQVDVAEYPAIIPLSAWIRQEFDRAGFDAATAHFHHVLDPFAAQLLWSDVIRAHEIQQPLLDVGQAASAAMDADSLTMEWDIQPQAVEQTPEYEAFSIWRDAYTQRLHTMQAVDSTRLYSFVIERLASQSMSHIKHIVFAGFTETSHRLGRLINTLAQTDVSLSGLKTNASVPAEPLKVRCQTPEMEWIQAARWAQVMLSKHPDKRFAIVAANLERVAPFARRVLHNALGGLSDPSHFFEPFNLAVGRPLADWPVGRAMLAWLQVFSNLKERGACDAVDVGEALLAGRCVGHLTEMGARAAIDAKIRSTQQCSLDLHQWRSFIQSATQLSSAWHEAWEAWSGLPSSQTGDAWALVFKQTLSCLGFPGDVSQRSAEYQATEALSDLFDHFVSLTPVVGTVSAGNALNILSRLCRQTLFQPQRTPDCRLDVLGLLEAEGGQWDGVWMLGLTDEVLPAAPKPNPFLPVSALRRVNAPRATPEREREWASQLYDNLLQAAPTVWVSWATLDGERELRPSPLIAWHAPEDASKWLPTPAQHQPVSLETLDDQSGPPVHEGDHVSGGVSLLETHSRNPLWAFIRHRLHTRGLVPHALLPSKTLRGDLIHGVFERVWSDIHSRDSLRDALSDDAFDARLHGMAIALAKQTLQGFPVALMEMEVARCCELVRRWLDVEAERTPFQVLGVEHRVVLQHGPLALSMRLDRLDRLPDGSQVVIDYKTGTALPDVLKDWTHARPVNVQLPAYSTLLARQDSQAGVSAMVLAHLHPTKLGATGIAKGDGIGLVGVTSFEDSRWTDDDWEHAMSRLGRAVDGLAAEFCAGSAQNVSWRKDDLQYCDVLPVLRCFDLSDEEDSDD